MDARDKTTKQELIMQILQDLYDSEINVKLGWQWDGGVGWALVEGYAAGETIACGNASTVNLAIADLAKAACEKYPESDFTKKHSKLCI